MASPRLLRKGEALHMLLLDGLLDDPSSNVKQVLDSEMPSVSELATPEEEDDLAVHPKKIEELKQWIRSRMAMERGAKTLLLTGPCGAGKTASLRVLCDELGVELVDFDGNHQEYELNYNGDEVRERSALRVFVQFMRSSQLSSIERMSLKHRLLLIEQLPNVFYRDLTLFHNTLREFVLTSRCMVAIVLSNIESCWELSPLRLFPAHILDEFSIEHIKFNAIATTNMTKAVKRIFSLLNMKLTSGSENASMVKEIVALADGDIRKGMSFVDFFLADRNAHRKKPSSRPKLSQLSVKTTPTNVKAQPKPPNSHVELFHFIGKLMYAKRAETADEQWRRCERKLAKKCRRKYARPTPPKDDLGELIGSSFVSGNFVAGYVFEHEPVFAPSVSSLASIATNLCEFDVNFSDNFEGNQVIDKYALEIAARSAVFHNYRSDPSFKPAASRRGLYQFKKPKLKENTVRRDEMKRTAIELFSTDFLRTSDIETLVLPMLPILRFTCSNKSQFELINKLRMDVTRSDGLQILPASQSGNSQSISSSARLFGNGALDGGTTYDEFNYEIEEIT